MPDERDDRPVTEEHTEIIDLRKDLPLEALPPGIRGQLKVIQGPMKGAVIELKAGLNTLGRDAHNTVRLGGRSVSGRHAAIFFTESMEWRIRDLGSTNGTLLNGSKVKEFALRSGDKVFIGDHLLVFSGDKE
jgi:pSer/pThr/pTyr-binding forkhead associated (FHA) protein